MEIIVCKSNELSTKHIDEIVQGLKVCLNVNTTAPKIKDYFGRSSLGYCFHAIALDDERVVGHTLIYPINYIVFGKKKLLSQSGSTYILEGYRGDVFLYKKMFDKLKNLVKENGVIAIFAVSNYNSFEYTIKFLKFKFLDNLSSFAIPAIGILKSKYSVLRIIFKSLGLPIMLILAISMVRTKLDSNKTVKLCIEDPYFRNRLKSESYKSIKILGIRYFYNVGSEKSYRVLYLLNVEGDYKNKVLNWMNRVLFLLIMNFKDVDLILEVGTAAKLFNQIPRVMTYFMPRKLPLSVLFLNDEIKQINIKDLDYSLLNFDVR